MLVTYQQPKKLGFTIVELLVVIVVIGILAAVSVVSYNGIAKKAEVTKIKSNLANDYKQLELYNITNDQYPSSLNCPANNDQYCPVTGDIEDYTYNVPPDRKTYSLNFTLTNDKVATVNSSGQNIICPTGFIPVPGSNNLGTKDFCVMKYEAKKDTGDVPVSRPEGTPWTGINHENARINSQKVKNCTDCHLITDKEWATIIESILQVDDNFYNSSGIKKLYIGHSDNVPNQSLSINDENDNYNQTGNSVPSGVAQRRTMKLTNGERIWDFSGNIAEMTEETIKGPKGDTYPSVTSTNLYYWNSSSITFPTTFNLARLDNLTNYRDDDSFGQLSITNNPASNIYPVTRGGCYDNNASCKAGIMAVNISSFVTIGTYNKVGFRVAAPSQE